MSKIFEALRRVELLRAKHKETKTAVACGYTDRRLASRIYVRIRLFIYGYMPCGDPFYEETHSIIVSGAGGLISMSSGVQPGQRLVITNEGNDQTQVCVVVSTEPYSSQIAIKFPSPTPQFWSNLEIGKNSGP